MTKLLPRLILNGVVAGLCLGIASIPAMATPITPEVQYVDMTFQSGATFSGVITFANNYTEVTGVTGTLYGYSSTNDTYASGTSDPISAIFTDYGTAPIGTNYAAQGSNSDDNVFGTFLTDTGSCLGDYCNAIDFTYDYTNAPNLVFAPNADLGGGQYPADGVNTNDPMIAGAVSVTPEPSSLSLLLLGMIGLGAFGWFARRSAKGQPAAGQSAAV